MAFPTTSVLDTFTRADNASLGANWAGPVFVGNFAPRIVGNQVGPDTDSGNSYASRYWLTPVATGQYEAGLTMGTVGSARREIYTNIGSPASGSENLYALAETFGVQFEWGIYRYLTGSSTLMGATFTQSYASGDKFGLEVVESISQKAYYKAAAGSWAQVGTTQSDSTLFGGSLGFAIQENLAAPRIDDFFGGDSVAATPAPAVRPDYSRFPKSVLRRT